MHQSTPENGYSAIVPREKEASHQAQAFHPNFAVNDGQAIETFGISLVL